VGLSGAASNANAGFVLESSTNHFAHLLVPDVNETGILFGRVASSTNSGIIYNNSLSPDGLLFRTGGNFNRMVITAAGNVGIGTTNPTERLMVVGNIDATDDLYTGATNGIINCGGGNMNTNINVIADATPTPLNANGDEDLYIADALELGGQGFKPGGGSWAAASDARLKKDIHPFNDGLDKILAIRPVSFKYNDHFKALDNGKTYIGVIAQEIKEVAPYTVQLTQFGQIKSEDANGNEQVVKEGEAFYSYDSSALTYMLINAIKELKQLNDDQQQQISELARQLEQLRQSK
jgi:Chaperone of endosialidase